MHWNKLLFINPEMVVGVEDAIIYNYDKDGKVFGNEGYTTKIYVSIG